MKHFVARTFQIPLFGYEQHQVTSDDYYTPPSIFESLGIEFDLDVCAPRGGVPWIPAARHFSIEDDGLAQPWEGKVWMNPPYSGPGPWVKRFIQHGDGVALVPITRSAALRDIWDSEAKLLYAPIDLKFVREGELQRITWPTILVGFGIECAKALENMGNAR